MKALKKKRYFIGCDGNPYKVERMFRLEWITNRQSLYEADVDGIPLDGKGYSCSCSIFHCIPEAISREEAYKLFSEKAA